MVSLYPGAMFLAPEGGFAHATPLPPPTWPPRPDPPSCPSSLMYIEARFRHADVRRRPRTFREVLLSARPAYVLPSPPPTLWLVVAVAICRGGRGFGRLDTRDCPRTQPGAAPVWPTYRCMAFDDVCQGGLLFFCLRVLDVLLSHSMFTRA